MRDHINTAAKKRYDIFCKIVDNFGDIGVCWRLAKQLANEHHLQVRLFIDDFASASKIIPELDFAKASQQINGIEICVWPTSAINPAEVVIETFACGLPDDFIRKMVQNKSIWINLEYLSAENWVSDFHAKPSPHPTLAITKHYFFPGFEDDTGGLIREENITQTYNTQNLNCHPDKGQNLVTSTALDSDPRRNDNDKSTLKISLFCYLNAPVEDLLTALQANNHAAFVYVPASSILQNIAKFFGKDSLEIGETLTRKNLTVQVLPFLSQADYDQLLHSCDLNFVRGEDSWVRAIWAGKPFIWQPYIQTENTHLEKLNAFLATFYANFEQKEMLCEAHQCWSAGHMPNDVLQRYLNNLPATQAYTLAQAKQLTAQTDLAAKLVIFCNNARL